MIKLTNLDDHNNEKVEIMRTNTKYQVPAPVAAAAANAMIEYLITQFVKAGIEQANEQTNKLTEEKVEELLKHLGWTRHTLEEAILEFMLNELRERAEAEAKANGKVNTNDQGTGEFQLPDLKTLVPAGAVKADEKDELPTGLYL